jgi:hypothetical protein
MTQQMERHDISATAASQKPRGDRLKTYRAPTLVKGPVLSGIAAGDSAHVIS